MLPLDKQNALRERYRRQRPGWRPATEVYADLVRDHLRPESRLLDLGCGRGGLVEQLAHPLSQMVGIDPDRVSLHEHRLALPRAQAFSQRLPFADDVFDVIYASWLLEHLSRPEEDFREIARVLRAGGVFVFITPNGRHPLSLFNHLLGRVGQLQGWLVRGFYGRSAADAFPTFYRANGRRDLERLAAVSQLRLERLEAVSDPTYLAFTPALFRLMRWLEERLPAERKLHLVGAMRAPARATDARGEGAG